MTKHIDKDLYIAIDWGTSRLKAYLCELTDMGFVTVLDEKTGQGVQKLKAEFDHAFLEITAEWKKRYGILPVLMGGQIASSIGWKESPYVACPVAPADILEASVEFGCDDYSIMMLPGLSCKLKNNHFDVMRSEEIQVLGWLQSDPQNRKGQYLICLPGTHTKWVLVKDGVIDIFKTAMTGELYDLLSTSSVLIQKPSSELDEECFNLGADYTLSSASGSLIHGLFSVRSKQLFEGYGHVQASSYLSGLLIGSDVRAATHADEWDMQKVEKVVVIGEDGINDLFANVLKKQVSKLVQVSGKEASVNGFAAIRHRQLSSVSF